MTASARSSVLVIGGGPAGCLAALRLARAGIDVALVDRGRRVPAIGETLSPDGRRTLSLAGLWQRRPQGVALRCGSMATAWESSHLYSRSFVTNPYGPAWHLDRERFDAWLVAEARAEGVVVVAATVRGIARADAGWTIELADGTRRSSSFVVAATGRTGTFATALSRRSWLDSRCAIGGYSVSATSSSDALLVEAVAHGWWYSMPTPDGRVFAAWVTDTRSLDGRQQRACFAESLHQTTYTLARVHEVGATLVRPAMSAILESCAGDAWIAIGDAALAQDPLSGDGIAAALRSGWAGAEAIIATLGGSHAAILDINERHQHAAHRYREIRSSAYRSHRRWAHAGLASPSPGGAPAVLDVPSIKT